MPRPTPPRRRRFQWGLRGLMLAVLVVGGLSGWMAHVIRTQREAIAAVKAAGGHPRFDWSREQVETTRPDGTKRLLPRREPNASPWLRRWLGDELFQVVVSVSFDRPVTPEAFAALDRFAALNRLSFSQTEPISVDLSRLRNLPQLEGLDLAASSISDATLRQVARLDALRYLSISRSASGISPATDAGFATLKRLPNLESLTINDCPFLGDAGAARMVEGLPRLRRLWVMTPLPTASALLPALAEHHPDLRELVLHRSGVRDEDLRWLEGLHRLEKLYLIQGKVTEAGLVYLRSLTNLRDLRLTENQVTDAGLPHLAPLTRLEILALGGTSVTDAGLTSLTPLVNLKSLSLDRTRVTDAGLLELACLPRLEQVRLAGLPITDAGVLALARLPRFRDLDVSQTRVTPAGLAALKWSLPGLTQPAFRALPPAASPKPASTPR